MSFFIPSMLLVACRFRKLRSAVVLAGFACFVSKFQKATLGTGSPSQRSHSVLQQDGTQSQLCCLTRTGWDSILYVLLDKNSLGLNRMCVA